jgi:DNA-directed RNA polymerase I, II, and III subunit RPABC1
MSESSEQINALYKSRVNLVSLLGAQGYNVSDYKNPSINDVHIMAQNKQLDFMVSNEETGAKTLVVYHLAKTLRPVVLNELVSEYYEVTKQLSATDSLVIVARLEPNDTLTRTIQSLWERNGYYINIFNVARLQFNILEHTYVPKHEVLSEEAKNEVIKKYNIISNNIPSISRFDPVAQAIALRPGQYCEITRPSRTAIQAKSYRVCL